MIASVEVIPPRTRTGLLLTCEHASNELPPGMSWGADAERLAGDHWAYDLGVAEMTRRLARELGCGAVLSTASRLVVDCNRPLDSDTLFRATADGLPVEMNQQLGAGDRYRRVMDFYEPFHCAIDRQVALHGVTHLLSIHSFTPLYEGDPRKVEVGVLFDRDEAWAHQWLEPFQRRGFETRMQEPYSGARGMMHSAQTHATRWGLKTIELEFRQDHTVHPRRARQLVDGMADALHGTPGLNLEPDRRKG